MAEQQPDQAKEQHVGKTPVLEWISGGIGLVLMLAMSSFIGWQAFKAPEPTPPVIDVRVDRIVAAGAGWVVEVVAANSSFSTAAAVQIQGELRQGEDVVAASQATFDYVPGRSEQRGGLYFEQDPAAYNLTVRALGFAKP